MDSHAFASLAHVRILLLPVGSIRHSTFEKFAAEIRAFDDIRLGDIPADHKDERGERDLVFWLHGLFYASQFQPASCPDLCPQDISTSVFHPTLRRLPILPCLSFVRHTSLWV